MKKSFLLFAGIFLLKFLINAAEPYKAGDIASDFSLKSVNGESVSLSTYENTKGFILLFTCNTCPFAKKYEQRIIDLHKEFSSKGYPVVAINSNDKEVSQGDSFEEMQNRAKNKGYGFNYLYDESQEVAKRYGATNTPHIYVLSKKAGKLVVEYVGAIDNNADEPSMADKKYVADAVNSLLKGEQVSVKSTKAIGCGIKWKRT